MSSRPSRFLLLLGLLLAAGAAAARPEFVLHAGVNASTIDQDDLSEDAREGLAVGLEVAIPLVEGFVLMPGVWYAQKGFKDGTLWEQIPLEAKVETLTLPVLLSYAFPARAADPRAFIGFALDLPLSQEIDRRDDDQGWLDVTDQAEGHYWSLVLGGGARFLGWLDAELRYQHGLTPVTDFDYEEFDDVIPVYHQFDDAFDRTWTLSLGVWF
jgi:hypothetical protein